MKSKATLERYYHSDLFNKLLWIPEYTSRHHFRFHFVSETKEYFLRIKDRIRTKRELIDKIRQYNPNEIFYSVTKWIDPVFYAKSKKRIDVMLSSPLFLDLDPPNSKNNISNFRWLIGNSKKITTFFKDQYMLDPKYIAFSGRGLHLVYENYDWHQLKVLAPNARLKQFKSNRRTLLKILKRLDIGIDFPIMLDPYRIARLPGSINLKTNRPCFILSLNEVENLSTLVEAIVDQFNLILEK